MTSMPLAPALRTILAETFAGSTSAHERFLSAEQGAVASAAAAVIEALRAGRKVLACGNGGSAADAQHLAAELVGRFTGDRRALAAVALTTDASVVTSVANDFGFERVFARQVEALGRPGDALVAISTSGRSPNVLAAVEAARAGRLVTIALTGRDGGPLGAAADVHVNVPDPSAQRAQEVHRTVIHALVAMVERALDLETPAHVSPRT